MHLRDSTENFPPNKSLECSTCKESLSGRRYIKKDNKPVCIPCFEKHYAHSCLKCNRLIGAEQREAKYKDDYWHDTCFTCNNCNGSLVEKEFACKSKNLYCLKCYEKMPTSKCCHCNCLFRDGQVTYEFDGKYWHEDCFKCQHCNQLIRSNLFILFNQHPLCVICYEQNYANKCIKCDKVISNGGVKVGEHHWHGSCFNCELCNKNLIDSEFTVSGQQIYCSTCFKQKGDKKCSHCGRSIKGGDENGRFVSFDGKNWHCRCFTCNVCGSNLVDKGFMTVEDEVLCPYCARNSVAGDNRDEDDDDDDYGAIGNIEKWRRRLKTGQGAYKTDLSFL